MNREILLTKKTNVNLLVELASWQKESLSPLCSLYINGSLDTYVPFAFQISSDVSQHQLFCILYQSSRIQGFLYD